MKPEVLFLAHRIPYPPDKGDKIRSWRLLRHLTQRFRVHLACFVDDKRDFAHVEFLESFCQSVAPIPLSPRLARAKSLSGLITGAPLSFRYFVDTRMSNAVAIARDRPLVAEIAFSSSMAPYIEKPIDGRKRIVDFCDADSEKWREYAAATFGPLSLLYKREAVQLARSETEIANWADASFAVTAHEAKIFNSRPRLRRPVGWFANGVDANIFDPELTKHDANYASDCVFVGAMDYRANVESVLDFVTHVWPRIRKNSPAARFAIVGANPTAKISQLHNRDGIIVTGRVEDVRPWLKGAKVVVAPLRVARGIQNKVLEAMAMEKPIVASTGAMSGIEAPEDAAIIADHAETVAVAINELLLAADKRTSLGASARRFVQSHFSWNAGMARFDQALDGLDLCSTAPSSSSSLSKSVTN